MQILKSQYWDVKTEKFKIDFTDLQIGTGNTANLFLKQHPRGTQILWSQIKLNQVFAGTLLNTISLRLQEFNTLGITDATSLAYNNLNGLSQVGEQFGSALAAPRIIDNVNPTPQPYVGPLLQVSKFYLRVVCNAAFNMQNLTAGNLTLWYSQFRAT